MWFVLIIFSLGLILGAVLWMRRLYKVTMFHVCVANCYIEEVASELRAHPRLVRARGSRRSTALHLAGLQGTGIANEIGCTTFYANLLNYDRDANYCGVMEILLDYGAHINAAGKGGWTALHLAAAYGKPEVLRFLVDRGATTDIKDKLGRTPLDRAIENNKIENVKCLESMHVEKNKYSDWKRQFPKSVGRKFFSDSRIVFSYPGDMRLMEANEENGIYSLVRPHDEFHFSIHCWPLDVAKDIERDIRRRSRILDNSCKCEFLEDVSFGDNSGIGNCFKSYDINGRFFGKAYHLLLKSKSSGEYVHIVLDSIASKKDFDINDYCEILTSVRVQSLKGASTNKI